MPHQRGKKMTCKNCLHYKVCNYHITEETGLPVGACVQSSDESKRMYLLYKVGDTVYYISGCREHPILRSATILNMTLCEGGILALYVLNEDCEKFMNAIDIFYLSREEAEKAIKEGVR